MRPRRRKFDIRKQKQTSREVPSTFYVAAQMSTQGLRATTFTYQEAVMNGMTVSIGELLIEVVNRQGAGRAFTFIDYEPRTPGYSSDIAAVYGCSDNQTDNLLDAVDEIDEHNGHFEVVPVVLREKSHGSKGEVIPAQIRKTIVPA